MIFVAGIFAGLMTSTKTDLAITVIVISSGISYGFSLVSIIISAFLRELIPLYIEDAYVATAAITLQFMLIFYLFRIKRFKSGIPFLKKRGVGAIGLAISGLILALVVLVGDENVTDDKLGALLFIGAILCISGLIIWWRRGLTNLYRERVKERNAQEYEAIIAEKNEQIRKLQESNDLMAKLIHRDNKLLPSMYEAVRSLYKDDVTDDSRRILDKIEQLMSERIGVIVHSQRVANNLPSTKDNLIDGVMNFMCAKANEKEIQFELAVSGEISELTSKIISPLKLETLIADLIENAIIATSYSEYKKILVTISNNDECYELNIYDSGIPFEPDTLMNLGQQKTSTHLDEGGSGIGYMTVFEILREVKASLLITEYEQKPCEFTKSVKVRFDNNNHYIIQPYHPDDFPQSERYAVTSAI
jgi:signal transduction histidine kinase